MLRNFLSREDLPLTARGLHYFPKEKTLHIHGLLHFQGQNQALCCIFGARDEEASISTRVEYGHHEHHYFNLVINQIVSEIRPKYGEAS